MRMGYFDRKDDRWVIPIPDKHGKHLDLHKDRVRTAKDKYDRKKKLHFEVKRLV